MNKTFDLLNTDELLEQIFRFIPLTERTRLRLVNTFFINAPQIDWNWCVLPEFRGENAKDNYLRNPASRITTKYFVQLIDRLSPGTRKFQADLQESIRLNPAFYSSSDCVYMNNTGLKVDADLNNQQNLQEIIMILRHHSDFDINQSEDPSYPHCTPLYKAISLVCDLALIKHLVSHGAKITLGCVDSAIDQPEVFEYLILQRPVCFEDEITFNLIRDRITMMSAECSHQEDRVSSFLKCEELLSEYRNKHLEYLEAKVRSQGI